MRWGLLLINLGTPDSPDTPDVRRYLDQFLMDPRVIDINPLGRAALVKLAILPFRPKESGEAYRQIWTERGSPLLFHTEDLAAGVRERLGDDVQVEIAMRYQSPSIESALDRFRANGVDQIVAFPLFPQYSSAATGSAVQELWERAGERWNTPSIVNVPAFYEHPAFIEAFAKVAEPILADMKPDRVLFSYHGLPERHVRKSDESEGQTHCLATAGCCDAITPANRHCYRAQCYATTRAIVARLGLAEGEYEVAFQSRLGRDPWIKPYTDERLEALPGEGIKSVAVMCPAFVADCLETLEEIGMRAEEDFKAAGGEALRLVPSLNSSPAWIDAVVRIAMDNTPAGWRG